jgi:hypothetical protein
LSPDLDPLTAAFLHGRERKAALHALLAGRAQSLPQAESPPPSTGFDGGARGTYWPWEDPVQEHDQHLIELLRSRAADVGRWL